MARFFRSFIVTLTCITIFTACQEGHEAGELLGQWRMAGSDTKYIRFSGNLTFISDLSAGGVWGHFQHEGDSLFIQCYSIDALPSDTALVEETYGFKPFTNIRLRIDKIDSDNLILSKGNDTWAFYKY